MYKCKVSFDFDYTLSRGSVQKFAKEIIDSVEVFVITSRPKNHKRNDELFRVTDLLGIKRCNVHFTQYTPKFNVIKQLGIGFHFDDDYIELNLINKHSKSTGISVESNAYSHKFYRLCLKFLQ